VESYEEKLEARGTRVAGHLSNVTALAFSSDGRLLVSASRDGTLRVWSVSAARETYAPFATGSSVLAMALVPERLCVAAVLADGRLVLWEFGSRRRVTHLRASDGSALRAVAVSPDGRWVAAGGGRRRLHLWQTEGGAASGEFGGAAGRIEALAFTADSCDLACGTHNGRVEMFERGSATPRWSVRSGRRRIAGIAAAGKGGPLVTAAADGTIVSWDPVSGGELQRSRPMPGRLATLAMVPDASLLPPARQCCPNSEPSESSPCLAVTRAPCPPRHWRQRASARPPAARTARSGCGTPRESMARGAFSSTTGCCMPARLETGAWPRAEGLHGKVASRVASGAGEQTLTLATTGQLPPGLYVLRLTQGGAAVTRRALVLPAR
jgi:hypothetical protein